MPRSYQAWMRAKRNFLSSQYERVAHIPYPDDAVVYERPSSNYYWESRRQAALQNVPTSLNLNFPIDRIEEFVRAAADFERDKENTFLDKFYTGPELKNESITDKFNILFQGRDIYARVNDRIKTILSTRQYQKNKTYGKKGGATHENYTGMAPNLSALFASYLETALQGPMQEMREKITGESSPAYMQHLFDEAFEKAVLIASERMTQITDDVGYGTGVDWKPIDEMLRNGDPRAKQLFMESLRGAIGNDNIQTLLDTMQAQKKPGVTKQQTRTLIKQNLKNIGGRTASIGGTVVENAMAMLASYINGMAGGTKDFHYQMAAEGILRNMVKTDTAMIFSASKTIDTGAVMQSLNEYLSSNNGNILNAYEKVQDFYDKWEKDLDELYTVFVNSKNYGIGADGRNYVDTQSGSLEDLPQFLQRAGIDVGSAHDFLALAYNTGEGAVRAGYRAEVMEECVNALKAAAAKLMFDDYQTLGRGEGNSIHMYYLSGKYVPASVVFYAMADAAHEAKVNSRATVTLPPPIDDRGPEWGDFRGKTDADFKEQLWAHWQQEYQDAKAASTWSVSFTLRIKDLLSM